MSEECSISVFVCKGCYTDENSLPVGGDVWTVCVSCRCGAVLLTTSGQTLMTSSDLDTQACLLQLTLRVVQLLLLEGTDALNWLAWSRNEEAFLWVVRTVSSTTNRITDSCVLAVCQSTSQFQSSFVCLSLMCLACYTVQGEHQSQNTVLSVRVFVTLPFEVPSYILA